MTEPKLEYKDKFMIVNDKVKTVREEDNLQQYLVIDSTTDNMDAILCIYQRVMYDNVVGCVPQGDWQCHYFKVGDPKKHNTFRIDGKIKFDLMFDLIVKVMNEDFGWRISKPEKE